MIVFVSGWGIFFFKQKTAYEMRISDWSSDVCSSDLLVAKLAFQKAQAGSLDDLECRDPGIAEPIDAAERFRIGVDELRQRPEFAQQRLGERLGVAARNGECEQIFDQLVIGQSFSVVEQARP